MTSTVDHADDFEVWQRARRLKSSTISEKRRVLEQFLGETGTQPASATVHEISRWFGGHEGWSQSTFCTYFQYFNGWYKWLQIEGVRPDNPMLRIGSPRAPERLPRPISDVDVRALLSGPSYRRTHAMIALAAFQGFRVHEVAKVRGEDFDLSAMTVRVLGKGGSNYLLPLHPYVAGIAQDMPRKGWWFPAPATWSGECVRPKSVSHTISQYMQRCNVPGTPHALRHFFATKLVEQGVDVMTVRDLMRHKNLQTTMIYAKLPDARRVEALAKVDPWR